MEGGLFRYERGFIPHYAKLASVFLPRMQNVKGGFFRFAVFREGCFFRRVFHPYTEGCWHLPTVSSDDGGTIVKKEKSQGECI